MHIPCSFAGEKEQNMSEKPKYYITTAIAYASRKPHFGNTYEVIMTDAVARYKRARGFDVFFCTGTDEHGQKIENYASEAGITPKAYVDGVAGEIRGVWDKMNTSYDYFIRTTDDYHERAVQKMFRKFYEQGDIYKGKYEGWYCKPCESFFTNTQVVDGKCPDCGAPVEKASEEAYFFKMSKYADRLLEHIESHPEFIEPASRKNEMVNNFLKAGLQDLCVSRSSFSWGIPVDFDSKHVVYVWLDALTNYITAIGYDPDLPYEEQSEQFKKYWPCDVHVIGKDILRFHTIYWPIFLMALGIPLPKKVFGHPWFNFGMDKMSKSKGNVIYADELADEFSVDGVRYYALSEMPYANDGSITYENVIKRYNADLVNNLGNLVKRTLDMEKKYFDKEVLAPTAPEALDSELKDACIKAYSSYIALMDDFRLADALEAVFEMFSRANKYIDETAPWVLAKDETKRERLGTVLYNLLEAIRWGAVMLAPFIPETSEEILGELGTDKRDFESIGTPERFGGMSAGSHVGDSKVLFARVDEAKKLAELEEKRLAKLAELKKAQEPESEKPEGLALIGIEDFMKVELRVAKILECEPVPKAKKLLKLKVDLGYEQRQVVSGIAKFYTPEELIGKKVVLVTNLRPATLCGIESNGMILASGEERVRVVFLDAETPLGERIR
ncbi:MAG: methionine--tRNA ligase [Eubacteriales bacterium]